MNRKISFFALISLFSISMQTAWTMEEDPKNKIKEYSFIKKEVSLALEKIMPVKFLTSEEIKSVEKEFTVKLCDIVKKAVKMQIQDYGDVVDECCVNISFVLNDTMLEDVLKELSVAANSEKEKSLLIKQKTLFTDSKNVLCGKLMDQLLKSNANKVLFDKFKKQFMRFYSKNNNGFFK